jgi:nucleotide-binding universal stress UspA family protein
MALKDLLVCLDQTGAAVTRLRLAADLARRHGSRLTALFVRELSQDQSEMRKNAELGLASGNDFDRVTQLIQRLIDDTTERLRAMIEDLSRQHGLEIEWRDLDGTASGVAPEEARYADLCILGPGNPQDGASVGYGFTERLLFETGRPLVFVPEFGAFESLGRHIVIGWNASRPAARAVSDALPLIERAERTTVVTIDSADFADHDGGPAADRLVRHLKHHNQAIDAVRITNVPAGAIAATLQDRARELGADLVVTGAYGHPKLWERLVGGVTRDLFDRTTLPMLMSH